MKLLSVVVLLVAFVASVKAEGLVYSVTSGLVTCGNMLCNTYATTSDQCGYDPILKKAVSLQLLDWWKKAPSSLSRDEIVVQQIELDKIKVFADSLTNECYRTAYRSWLELANGALQSRRRELDADDLARDLMKQLPKPPR